MIAQKFYDLLSDDGAQEFLDYCENHNEHVRHVADPKGHWESNVIDTRDESVDEQFLVVSPLNSWEYVILYFLDGKKSNGMPIEEA